MSYNVNIGGQSDLNCNPTTAVPLYRSKTSDPTQYNTQNFTLGWHWLNESNQALWYLAALAYNHSSGQFLATWLKISAGNTVLGLTSNSGGEVFPLAGNINVVGDGTTIVGVGNPATHTITFSASGTGLVSSLTGNSGGAVFPTAGNINTVGSGVITVVGNPGTSTLTITPSGAIASSFPTDSGTAVPSAGALTIHGTGGITTSGAGSTVTITGTSGTVTTLHTDDGHNVTATAGVINLVGAHGLNTTGTVGPNTATVAINNAITLGDLSAIGAGSNALSCTTGDINIAAANLKLANTNSGGTQGVILLGGNNFIHNYGSTGRCTYVGQSAGNTSGSVRDNTGVGYLALTSVGATGVTNVAVGTVALTSCVGASANTGVGYSALQFLTGNSNTTGQNTAIGHSALTALTEADSNTAVGHECLTMLTTGTQNLALGNISGVNLATGSFNIIIGVSPTTGGIPSINGAGYAYTGAESSNLIIGNQGVNGESNVIRIGTSGSGATQQNKAFMAGIRGVTTDSADAIAVLISSTGQLGTVSSSGKLKDNIKDMENESQGILDLRPVTFHYKSDKTKSKQYGLIAEEVIKHMPRLVVFDKDGEPETVKYHDLPILLLNEIQNMVSVIDELRQRIEDLESEMN